MSRLLKEPLLHFLVIGVLLFTAYRVLNPPAEDAPDEIVVSAGKVHHLVATFGRTWQRPPTPEELKGLVDGYIREEMLAREAVKLGLDRDDTIIRRRLGQKMDFLIDDVGAAARPTTAQLEEFLSENPDAFRQAPLYSLRQVFLSPDKRGDALEGDADQILGELRSAGKEALTASLGDQTMLPEAFDEVTDAQIDSTLGQGFAELLDALPVGEWSGPVQSAFGLHLVFLSKRQAGAIPLLENVRDEVEREWTHRQRSEIRAKALESMLSNYHVTIEWPESEPNLAARE